MEDSKSAENAVRNLPTVDMMAASILEFLGDGVFGTLHGAAPNEQDKMADAKRHRRRCNRLAQSIQNERDELLKRSLGRMVI